MSKYCPYTDSNTIYLSCQECDNDICSPDTFFCLVVGSRTFNNYSKLRQTLDYLLLNHSTIVIVSGGAVGTDSLAKQYAKEKGYVFIGFPAQWDKYGKSAGYIRNEQMHKFIAKQAKRGVIAFWDGKSKGTQHSFKLAKKYNNIIKIIGVRNDQNLI